MRANEFVIENSGRGKIEVRQAAKLTNKHARKGVAEGSENNNTTAQKIFFARSNKIPKGWSYDHVGFITQDGKQIQMSGHKGNDVYVTNDVTDDPEFPKQNIKIVSLSKPVSVPTTNSVGAENCGTFVANVLQANGIKGIDTQKIYSVFKKHQEQDVAEDSLNEVLNTKPSQVNKANWKNSGDDITSLNFTVSNGIHYQLSFTDMYMAPDYVDQWDFIPDDTPDQISDNGKFVEFVQEKEQGDGHGKQGIEGTGAAAEVFGIVYNAIREFVQKYKPTYLMFQASEPSRIRLYSTLVRKMLQTMPGWATQQKGGVFFVYNKKYFKQGVAEGTEKVNSLTNAVISFYKPVVDQIEPGSVDNYVKQAKELLNQAPDPTIRSRMLEIFRKGQKDPMIQGGVVTAIAAILTGGLLSSASRMGLSPAQTNMLLQAVLNTVIPTIIARINNKSWRDTIKYTLASVGVGMTAAATLSEKRVTEGLSIDVPNEEWLQGKIDYAKSKGRDEWGAPFFGSTTAYARPDPQVSVVRLELLKGMRNEQNNVRKTDLEWLMAHMEKTGKLPPDPHGNEYAPYVMVAYNGEAWVSEGNHRIMAAYRLGWEKMPVQLAYFDGGERVQDGIMYPGKIGLGQQAVSENFADGKNPQDKGDSQRHGIPKGATMAQLEKAARAPGRKGQLARWQLNMRRGKKK